MCYRRVNRNLNLKRPHSEFPGHWHPPRSSGDTVTGFYPGRALSLTVTVLVPVR